jgi:hypothetical protein
MYLLPYTWGKLPVNVYVSFTLHLGKTLSGSLCIFYLTPGENSQWKSMYLLPYTWAKLPVKVYVSFTLHLGKTPSGSLCIFYFWKINVIFVMRMIMWSSHRNPYKSVNEL